MRGVSKPLVIAIVVVALLLLGGASLVWDKTATTSRGGNPSWGSLGDIRDSGGSSPLSVTPGAVEYTETRDFGGFDQDGSDGYASLIPQTNVYDSINTEIGTNTELTFEGQDLEDLLAQISSTAQQGGVSNPFGSNVSLDDIYSFVPGELATNTPYYLQDITSEQEEFQFYGNQVGSFVQSYSTNNADQAVVLRQFIEDRDDEFKQQNARRLAEDLRAVGENMLTLENIPEEMQALHDNLAGDYIAIGEKLVEVSEAQTDRELLDAVNAYNTSADDYAQSFLAMATFFSVAEVPFSSTDPGSVFVFTPTSGLLGQ